MEISSSTLLEMRLFWAKEKYALFPDKMQSRDVSSDLKKVHFQKVH